MPLGTNASRGGIFPKCSRFNHSCCSNAGYSWCNKLGLERVFAVKDIKEGKEISVSYLSEHLWTTARSERRQHLLDEFGFRCCCDICSQDTEDVSATDTRRQKLSQLDAAIGEGRWLDTGHPTRDQTPICGSPLVGPTSHIHRLLRRRCHQGARRQRPMQR